jgi:hypothetical protein
VHFAIVLTNRTTLRATREAGLVQIAELLTENGSSLGSQLLSGIAAFTRTQALAAPRDLRCLQIAPSEKFGMMIGWRRPFFDTRIHNIP